MEPTPRFARVTSAVLLRHAIALAKLHGKPRITLECDRAEAIADELERVDAQRTA